jgi:hypothetical protein
MSIVPYPQRPDSPRHSLALMATSNETDPPIEPPPARRRYILDDEEELDLPGVGPEAAKLLAEELSLGESCSFGLTTTAMPAQTDPSTASVDLSDTDSRTDPSIESSPACRRYIPDGAPDMYCGDLYGGEDMELLAEELATNKTLKKLELYENGIGCAGITALGQALMHNDSLEELSVDAIESGTVGLTTFANALKVNKSLKKLELGDYYDEGVRTR